MLFFSVGYYAGLQMLGRMGPKNMTTYQVAYQLVTFKSGKDDYYFFQSLTSQSLKTIRAVSDGQSWMTFKTPTVSWAFKYSSWLLAAKECFTIGFCWELNIVICSVLMGCFKKMCF